MKYGKFKRGKSPSPSSSMAVAAEMAKMPHADLLPPPDPMIAETARRSEISNEARTLFYKGLLGHEILERYPDERHWMADKIGDWEVVFRREQIQFVENIDKPAPSFTPVNDRSAEPRTALPAIAIDRPHLRAVAIKVDVCSDKTGEITQELVWFPRKFVKDGTAPEWLVRKKREELEAKFPKCSFDGLPE